MGGRRFRYIKRLHGPDVAILDVQMPRLNGLGATKQIMAEFSGARILLFTTYDGDEDTYRAMHAGARGYILKDAGQEDLFEAALIAEKRGFLRDSGPARNVTECGGSNSRARRCA